MSLSQKEILSLFEYSDGSYIDGKYNFQGALLWKKKETYPNRILGVINKVGAPIAGSWGLRHRAPYQRVNVSGKLYYVHRLIWIYHFGDLSAEEDVDHIDVNTLNNRIENLRRAEKRWNAKNRKPKVGGSSKYVGVSLNKKGTAWRARYTKNRVDHLVGEFPTEFLAAKARDRAVREAFGEFAYINIKIHDLA